MPITVISTYSMEKIVAFDVSKAYDVMKSLAQKVSGSEEVSRSDAKKNV